MDVFMMVEKPNDILKPVNLDEIDSMDIVGSEQDILEETVPIVINNSDESGGVVIPDSDEMSIDSQSQELAIDEDVCCLIYETLFNMGSSLINKDTEINLPQNRVKSQGKLLCKLLEKYQVSTDNMDTVLFIMGIALDYKYIKQEQEGV